MSGMGTPSSSSRMHMGIAGSDIGPQGPQGAAGATGAQGANGTGLSHPEGAAVVHYGLPGVVLTSLTAAQSTTAQQVYYMPFVVEKTVTVTALKCQISNTATAGAKVRMAIYASDVNYQPSALISDLGDLTVGGGSGIKTISSLNVQLTPGIYLLRMHTDNSGTQAAFNTSRGAPSSGQPFDAITNWQLVFQLVKSATAYQNAESSSFLTWTAQGTSTGPFMYWAFLTWTPT